MYEMAQTNTDQNWHPPGPGNEGQGIRHHPQCAYFYVRFGAPSAINQ
jgi:hypothetical protein